MIDDTDWLLHNAASRAGPSTIPILALQDMPRQHGTGTLVRLADTFFLVSAAHVLLQAIEHHVPLYLAANNSLLPLQTKGSNHTNEYQPLLRSKDPFDIVVWELHDELVAELGSSRFLYQSDLQPHPDLSGGRFLVYGYPAEWSAPSLAKPRTIEQAPIAILSIPYRDEVQFDGYDPNVNILLTYGTNIVSLGA